MSQADLARNVARVRAGETDAWGQLYEELAPSVFRLSRRVLPTREDAEDATTEIFLKVRLRLDQYDSSRPFRPWLYKLASNHCWDELRKRRARGETEAGDLDARCTPRAPDIISRLNRLNRANSRPFWPSKIGRISAGRLPSSVIEIA